MKYICFTMIAQLLDDDGEAYTAIGIPATKARMLCLECSDGQTHDQREREIGRSIQSRAIEAMRDVLHFNKADA